ncbi:glutaminase liver isoform, mitochondrial isoform X1 [Entelurus aequoreus]|uniref:glutaminase liver isoform, mitochondrial isoform X1 n=2 Tax=Entelurus aequoreus TaxID=161455 RepID=UPI002B1D46CF|nr:glutaminase liver isoform, mitochondrial isoform X1 [Entelurus aequoreus]
MEKHPNAETLTEDIACVCLQRSSSLRRKWRKRYGGLDGNKLLEPEEDLLQATEEAHKMDDSKLRNADDQVTAPRPASRILTQNHPPSPVQRPISLVSPGAAGAPGAWCPVVPVSANGSCLKPLPPQALVPPKDRCPQVAQSWCPPQQTPTKRKAAADVLFDTFACDGRINTNHFFEAVWSSGLHRSDSRLRDCLSLLRKLQDADSSVDRSTFHRCVTGVVSLLMKALQGRLVIPDFCSFTEDTQKLFSRCRQMSCAQNKDNMDATKWAVSVCTVDGQRLSLGDWATALPLGELSWPLVYGVAVELLGSQLVHRYVGVEPYCTRESPFSLSKAGTPRSPLTETGAIVTTSLLQLPGRLCADEEEKYDSVLNVIQRLCNKEHANINCSSFQSGKNANVRLQALAFYLQEKKCSPEKTDVNAALDLLLQCSSTEVTCESGAAMAASLANGGLCPLSGDQVLSPATTRSVLSVMQVAGMKDYSAAFLYKASIPAVASIHGGLLAVIPGVLGLMAFSPELDAYGNPWRAVHFCQELVSTFQLHAFDIRTPFRQVLAYRQWKAESEGYHIINVLLAAFKGDVGALRRYFLSGVDVNAVDYDGRSALHLAAAEGHTEVIRFLLENAGANAALKDRWGTSPLQEARRHNRDGAVQLLQGTS